MSSVYFKTEGLVMKKMPFGEADFLVRILSRDFGKIDILAKGARKAHSKLNPHIDILNQIRVSFVKNGERLPTLTDAEVIAKFDDWFLEADRLSVAGRVLQVLDLIILSSSKDEELYAMAVKFFSAQGAGTSQVSGWKKTDSDEAHAIKFLHEVFAHEGHGGELPPEQFQNIIKLWPILKNQ